MIDHHTVAAIIIVGTSLDVLGSLYLAYDCATAPSQIVVHSPSTNPQPIYKIVILSEAKDLL